MEENIDKKQVELEKKLDELYKIREETQQSYQASINEMIRIFSEEREKVENGDLFRTVEELDEFTAKYMNMKIAENERFLAAKKELELQARKEKRLEKQILNRLKVQEDAKQYSLSLEEMDNIKSILDNNKKMKDYFISKGLGEIVNKKGGRTKEEKKVIEEARKELLEQLVEEQKNTKDLIDAKQIIARVVEDENVPKLSLGSMKWALPQNEMLLLEDKGKQLPMILKQTKEKVTPSAPKGFEKVMEKKENNIKEYTNDISSIGMSDDEIRLSQEKINNYIPGTTIPKPRNRGIYESNEEYEDFLRDYYEEVFPNHTGTEVSDDIPRIDEPTTEQEIQRIEGPVAGQDIPRIEGPVAGQDIQRIEGPVAGQDIPRIEGPIAGQDIPRIEGPVAGKTPLLTDDIIKDDTKPIPEPKPVPEPETKTTKEEPKVGLIQIIQELTDGLEITKKDGKRYKASNIKVADSFRKELHSGNYLYNIVHFVPAIIKLPIKVISKIVNKVVYRKEAKERIETLKERLSKLPEDRLETIWNEYRGNRIIQERFPTAINTIIEERMQKYAMEKVTKINKTLETQYADIFKTIRQLEAIDRKMKSSKMSPDEHKSLLETRNSLLSGKAEEIAAIRKNYVDANMILSGGLHGFEEDMKAGSTKLSIVGMRFAKDHDLDLTLLKQEAMYEQLENKAIAEHDDEKALKSFVKAETLLSSNTEISSGIQGKHSTGKKYYSPLAEMLDYRDDPFVRDLFTTIAVTGAAVSAVNAFRVRAEQQELLKQQQAEATRVNGTNNDTINQVHQSGTDIAGKREPMMEGMKQQSTQDTLNAGNQVERATLDKNDWHFNDQYHIDDPTGHEFYNSFYEQTQKSIEDVATKYASGQVTQAEAMKLISDINATTQSTLGNVTNSCLDILKPYIESHPQFDLRSIEGAMTKFIENPSAISDMNQAMIDVTNIGDKLTTLTMEEVTALKSIPSDLQTTLFGAATAGALAARVSSEMTTNAKKGKYGNEVINLVDDYTEEKESQLEEMMNNKEDSSKEVKQETSIPTK